MVPRHGGGGSTVCMPKKPTPTSTTSTPTTPFLPHILIRQGWCAHDSYCPPGGGGGTLSFSFFSQSCEHG